MESQLKRMLIHSHDMWLKSVIEFLRAVQTSEFLTKESPVTGRICESAAHFVNLALRDEDEIGFVMRKEWV